MIIKLFLLLYTKKFIFSSSKKNTHLYEIINGKIMVIILQTMQNADLSMHLKMILFSWV
jgi:hypothetical protein